MLATTIDTDNAMGSRRGDIDDGFALAAMLSSSFRVTAITTVFGNTSSQQSFDNTHALAKAFTYKGLVVKGGQEENNEAAALLREQENDYHLLALGPLTNLAQALNTPAKSVVIVGGNYSSKGRWPPIYPFEYNLIKDKAATVKVFNSELPLTIVPLDVAKQFRFRFSDLENIP